MTPTTLNTVTRKNAQPDSAITMLLGTGSSFLILTGIALAFAPSMTGML